MPLIQYPDVPQTAGVPQLPRSVSAPPSSSQPVGIAPQSPVTVAYVAQWGIYDSKGNQVAASADSEASLGMFDFTYRKHMEISTFPTQDGGFAAYNKVEMPADPKVTLLFEGSLQDRQSFFDELDAACKSLNLYSVITPDVQYVNYSIMDYVYHRAAARGATLLIVEVTLRESRSVTAVFTLTVPAITNPVNLNATSQVNGGTVQPAPATPATAKAVQSVPVPATGGA